MTMRFADPARVGAGIRERRYWHSVPWLRTTASAIDGPPGSRGQQSRSRLDGLGRVRFEQRTGCPVRGEDSSASGATGFCESRAPTARERADETEHPNSQQIFPSASAVIRACAKPRQRSVSVQCAQTIIKSVPRFEQPHGGGRVLEQARHRVHADVIGDDDALESELFPQHIVNEPPRHRRR